MVQRFKNTITNGKTVFFLYSLRIWIMFSIYNINLLNQKSIVITVIIILMDYSSKSYPLLPNKNFLWSFSCLICYNPSYSIPLNNLESISPTLMFDISLCECEGKLTYSPLYPKSSTVHFTKHVLRDQRTF